MGARWRPTPRWNEWTREALEALRADIAAARRGAQLVIVALHKGIVHTPARLAPYERPLAEAAIDAGADVVVGHHAHILRGIELYRGKPIFHGLGNGCVVTHALSPDQDHPTARRVGTTAARAVRLRARSPLSRSRPFIPRPSMRCWAVVRWRADGSLETSVRPVFVEPPGRPVSVEDERADAVIAYLDRIGKAAGLPSRQWTRTGAQWVCT